jgi:GNAT superfamily N-acetyltransferase
VLLRSSPDAPEARPLLEALEEEYARRYGANDELSAYGADEFAPPAGLFLLLQEGGVTVAGGGLRRIDDATAEIKRMWTAEHARRRGHARTVLSALEEGACSRGYARIVLETGTEQPEAVALYAAAGYSRIAPYGRYRDDPRSICMAKALEGG